MAISENIKNTTKAVNDQDSSSLFRAITPSDTEVLSGNVIPRGVYIGGGGDLAVEDQAGAEVIFKGILAGTVLPIKPKRIKATGTTATNIIALL